MRALKARNPRIKVLVYKNLSASQKSSSRGRWATGVSFQEADSEHPEWFLLNSSGERFTFRRYPYLWAMDVGDTAYQERWVANVRRELRTEDWDGVFIDDVNPTMKYHYEPSEIARYPSDEAWQDATESALSYIGPRLRRRGKLVVPNFGSWSEQGYTDLVDGWMKYVNGGAHEHFLKWGRKGTGYADPERWRRALSSLEKTQAAGKLFLGLTTSGNRDVRAARYGWATMLLGANGDAAFAMQRDTEAEPWFPEYRYKLGRPLERVEEVGDGAFRRRFKHGIAVVNPTYERVAVPLGATYSGSGRKRVRSVELRPESAAILVRAR
jgi:hypothetical protein